MNLLRRCRRTNLLDAAQHERDGEDTERASGSGYAVRTSYDYNGLFNLTKVVDSRGDKTVYTYDSNGDRTGETNPDGDQTKWTYDSHRSQRRDS